MELNVTVKKPQVTVEGKELVFTAKLLDKALHQYITPLSMARKRVFHKTIENFARELSEAFEAVPEIIEPYLQLNHMISEYEFLSAENFKKVDDASEYQTGNQLIELIDEHLCSNEALLVYIIEKVENVYNINIESESNKDNSLQFTNVYAKRIIAAGILARIVFPLLCNFMNVNEIRKEELLFMDMAGKIFSHLNFDDEGKPLNLLVKIQKFVATSVENTLYSDQVIWTYLRNLSITEKTVSLDIHRNLICNILPKLDIDRSIVAFFHVVIKKQIEYQFTSNFKMSYKPIKIIQTSEQGVNPFIKIEQRLIKNTSEFNIVMMKKDLEHFIKNNSILSADELQYHLQKVTIHTAQTKILSIFINKQIGRGIPVMSLSKVEYIQILFIAKEWFEKNGYTFISFILLGSPIPKKKNTIRLNKGKMLQEITQSRVYKDIEKRYELMGEKVGQEEILSFVGEIINTDFFPYTLYGETEPFCPPEVASLKTVIVELLSFVRTL